MSDISAEWQKMISGEIYNACDNHLLDVLASTRIKLWRLNNLSPEDKVESRSIIRSLLGSCGENFRFNTPFRCDYGCNIHIGEDFFANFNLTILDEAPVKIGNHVFIGPNVSIYTACHPLDADERNTWVEWAESVTIGDNVWIGGSVTICPGVTIGDNVVIGAGAVVTRDIPSDVVAAGNPARIIKTLK
ncbi:MAG: sugar O-acetyltransferase [Muribaculaceae bacterium]|nr:sugar O-acetyltransferase [Muribaculaceae bacterium]